MVYQPDYTLKVGDKDIHFLFTSFMFKKFCDRKGIELDELFQVVKKAFTSQDKMPEELKAVRDIKAEDYVDMLLAAHETYCIYHKQPFTATVPDAYAWIDEMGGFVGGMNNRNQVFVLFVSKLLNIDSSVLRATSEQVEDGEKNVKAPALNDSPGANSTSEQQQRA